jgi:DNA-binding IclR family transcriptional regulator
MADVEKDDDETGSWDGGRIPTNLRALMILEVLAKAGEPLTPTEINSSLGLPKQTIHRLCTTLLSEGFLGRDANPKKLRPSRRSRAIASGLMAASRSHIARHQILVDVAREVGETVNFVLPEDQGMMYADRVETNWVFRVELPIGTHVPFHCTASGKCFLANQSRRSREALTASLRLERLTPNTICDLHDLNTELNAVRKNGYSTDNEEFVSGMMALAVPVIDPAGRFHAALAFHGPTQRMSLKQAHTHLPVLTAAAQRLERVLFDE